VLDQLRSTLLAKNVAHGVASELCESVCASLVDTKQPSFTTLATTVRTALENALTRILTPKEPFELLQSIGRVNASGRPYSIVFIGVNGVGKSTSLAKTAAYLMSKNFKVSITACDTFRSGAIEQLKTHALALEVPLYDRGYDKVEDCLCNFYMMGLGCVGRCCAWHSKSPKGRPSGCFN